MPPAPGSRRWSAVEVQEVESPAGGSDGLWPHSASIPWTVEHGVLPEALALVGQRGGPVAQRPGHARRTGDVRRGLQLLDMERQDACDTGTVWRTSEFLTGLSPASRL